MCPVENPVKYLLSIRQRSQGAQAVCLSQRHEDAREVGSRLPTAPLSGFGTCHQFMPLVTVSGSQTFLPLVSQITPNLGGYTCRDSLLNRNKAQDRGVPGSNEMQEAMLCFHSPNAVDGGRGLFFISLEKHEEGVLCSDTEFCLLGLTLQIIKTNNRTSDLAQHVEM